MKIIIQRPPQPPFEYDDAPDSLDTNGDLIEFNREIYKFIGETDKGVRFYSYINQPVFVK